MSSELKQFLTEWLIWAESDNPDLSFSRQRGLCNNVPNATRAELEKILQYEFGHHWVFPFGENSYHHDFDKETMHLNQCRLAWVRKQLEK